LPPLIYSLGREECFKVLRLLGEKKHTFRESLVSVALLFNIGEGGAVYTLTSAVEAEGCSVSGGGE